MADFHTSPIADEAASPSQCIGLRSIAKMCWGGCWDMGQFAFRRSR